MTHLDSMAPWHVESYERLLRADLPELLASRLPLDTYRVADPSEGCVAVEVTLANDRGSGRSQVLLPWPDRDGVFEVAGRKVVIIPVASSEDLANAEIRCVGELLFALIEPRVAEAPPDLVWTDGLVASYLPLDQWILGFLDGSQAPVFETATIVQTVTETNGFACVEHSRRLVVDVGAGREPAIHRSHLGRVCPIMMPEGPNFGRVMSIARGATIREQRLVIDDERPEMKLSLTASAIPLLQHDDTNRLLMGANMMRQWLPPDTPEPALVQTGTEPAAPGFWCGHNLLTAFVSWGADTFEDAIVISESCAARLSQGGVAEPGDKLSNRHGTKGVISRILPDREMPHLPDGTPVELVFNFIGQHTRMNCGQLREALLGRLARKAGAPVVLPPFTGPTHTELKGMLRDAGFPENGMEVLRMGTEGPALARPSTVGYVYWGKTYHLASTKLQIHTDGGGNRQGELEYDLFRKVGASALIAETFGLRAIEGGNAAGLAERLAREAVAPPRTPLPLFHDLQRRLRIAGVKMELSDGHVAFSLEPPEGEVLALACPVPHPWLDGHMLATVGWADDIPEFGALLAANQRMQGMLEAGCPRSLTTRARRNLVTCVGNLFGALLRPEHLRPGNRVAFSARSVIAPGDGLRWDQVGLPEEMAWKLFGPVLNRKLGDSQAVREQTPEAIAVLDRILAESWVLVNRAPSICLTSLLAFHPVRMSGRVIRLPLLACMPLNADFDGDQAAVLLPVTAEGQREAGTKFSIAAHLERDPDLLNLLLPTHDSLLGLAYLSLTEEGRKRIDEIAESARIEYGDYLDSQSLCRAMAELFQREGASKTLDVLQCLRRLGQDAIMRSGASACAFAGDSLSTPAQPPAAEDVGVCLAWNDNLDDLLVSRDDYDSLEYGPQLLAVKCGARGTPQQLRNTMLGTFVTDLDQHLVFVPTGYIEGHRSDDVFTWSVGARRALAQVLTRCDKLCDEQRNDSVPEGFHVLARAMRSRCPGQVLARAAAVGEVDPLQDRDSRALTGMLQSEE